MSDMKQFYVGVKGIIVNPITKQALILRAKDQNNKTYWDIPGGRINDNERTEETLTRELSEEISNIKDFEIKELLHAYRLSMDLKNGLGLVLLFYKVESSITDVELSEEHEGYKWVNLQDLNNLNSDDTYIESGYLKALELALK